MKHAKFSPSGLYRLMACPGSLMESTYAPIQASSIYAQHGTLLHDYVTKAWYSNEPEDYMNRDRNLEKEDKEYVLECIDFLRTLWATCGENATLELETRVSLDTWGLSEVWGTADVIIRDPDNGRIHVPDWKFGSGVRVDAYKNKQGMTYAAGAAGFPHTYTDIHIYIVQPPINNITEYIVSPDELKQHVSDIADAIGRATSPHPELVPGEDQCRFCPAAITCKARYDDAVKIAGEVFSELTENRTITSSEKARLLTLGSRFVKYYKEMQVSVEADILNGIVVPGFKVVSGRSNRKWFNEKSATRWLLMNSDIVDDDMFTSKFISPAQAEKLSRKLKKDTGFKELINKPEGKPQLVNESDPRPPISTEQDASRAFNELTQ